MKSINTKMEPNKKMFPELERQIFEKGILKKDIADELGISIFGLSKKLSGKCPFLLREALIIHDRFFPDTSIIDLFRKKD